MLEYIRKLLRIAERAADAMKYALKRRLHLLGPIRIQPYRGYGTKEQLHLVGRVLENRDIGSASRDDPWYRNAAATVRRFLTDEVPGVRLEATYHGLTVEITTDRDGYFHLDLQPPSPPSPEKLWHEVSLRLLDRVSEDDSVVAVGKVLVPPEKSEFGVISDVDDTIVKSSAYDFFRLVWLTLINNAHTRTPFPHVAAFYRALQHGTRGSGPNPIFYVSSSAWNIYDLLDDFIRIHGIPQGPIMLRNLRIENHKFFKSDHQHKLEKIDRILTTYPELPFVLIGDSGQRDPWLYQEVVRSHPERIAAIYIRDVSRRRRERVQLVVGQMGKTGVDMVLVADALAAAQHAVEKGLIRQASLAEIAGSQE